MKISSWLSAVLAASFGLAGRQLTAAPAASPSDLLRQGVIAEETSKSPDEAIALYKRAVEAGEPLRIATATALYRLGELEWRGGKTNEAIRTWRLLEAQYADQTNLIRLARERVPLGVSIVQGIPSPSANSGGAITTAEVDISPEEQAELARVQRLWRDSPDLITSGVASNSRSRSPMENAAEKGYTRVLEFLVGKKMRLEGTRSLSLAALAGQLAAVQLLLRAGADPNNSGGFATPLLCAAARGHRRVTEVLIKAGAQVDLPSPYGDFLKYPNNGPNALTCPIHAAVTQGMQNTLELLVESGANINATDWKGSTPLHLAAWAMKPESLNYLLSKKAQVNNTDIAGNTPLVEANDSPTRQALLLAGADPNIYPHVERAPLWVAVKNGELEIVELLVHKGARVDLESGGTPLFNLAVEKTNGKTRLAINEILHKAGAQFANKKNQRFLQAAVQREDPDLVEQALRFGEKADQEDDEYSLLTYSAHRNLQIVEILLAAGADPNKRGTGNNNVSAFESVRSAILNYRQAGRQLTETQYNKILDLLSAKGGRLFFSNTNRIAFASDLTNSLNAVFLRTPVSEEREFTLAELLDVMLLRTLEPGQQDRTLMPWYPDLAAAYLYNDLERTPAPRKKPLDIVALIESNDFGKAQRLEWGDVLVIPKRARQGDEQPYVLPAAKAEALDRAIRKAIVVKSADVTLPLVFQRGLVIEPNQISTPGLNPERQPVIRSVARIVERMGTGKGPIKFHNRFRVVRRGEPGPLDQVFLFDATFNSGLSPQAGALSAAASQFTSGFNRPIAAPQPPSPNRPTGAQAATEEFPNGDSFILQDGDVVTLYPLPTP